MGNSCACLGGGRDYPMVGRKKPEAEEVHYDLNASSENRGSYRKTATSSKYAVAESSNKTDLNKNKSEKVVIDTNLEDPELKLGLQTPTSTGEDLDQTVPDERAQVHDIQELTDVVSTSASAGPANTHIETFAAPTGDNVVPQQDISPAQETARTHTEVFSLNIPTNIASDHKEDTVTATNVSQQPDAVHINLTDYLTEEKSPESSPSHHAASPASAASSGVDNPVFTDTQAVPEPAQNVPVIDMSQHATASTTPLSDVSGSGVSNEAFDMSDEQEPSKGVTAVAQEDKPVVEVEPEKNTRISPVCVVKPLVRGEPEGGCNVPAAGEETYFFFGMESLKFQSKKPAEFNGVQADMEVAEMMGVLDTIEDQIWLKLSPPVDDTDGTSPDRTGDHWRKSPEDRDRLYGDVLGQLEIVCNKVEDILRRKGVGATEEFDESWLNLPALTDIDKRYETGTSSAQTETTNRLLQASANNDEDKVKEILNDYKRQQERLMRLRESERSSLAQRLQSKLANRNKGGDDRNASDGDSDTELIQSRYGDIIKSDDNPAHGDGFVPSGVSDSEEFTDDSEATSEDDTAVFTEADLMATKTLKETLTRDIRSNMHEMTSEDFQSIMGIYRKERQNIRDIRESERGKYEASLWEKMAERRRHVDHSIYDGSSNLNGDEVTVNGHSSTHDAQTEPEVVNVQDTGTGTENTRNTETGINVGVETQDAGVGVNEEDLNRMTADVLSGTFHRTHRETVDQDEANNILQDHFERVKKLREQKEADLEKHKQKLQEKLGNRIQTTDLDADDTMSEDMEKEEEILDKEDDFVEQECLGKLKDHSTVTEDQLRSILDQYKESQQSLAEQRIRQKTAHNQRLQEKLGINKRPQSGSKRAMRQEEQIQSMDDAFYHSLIEKRQEGELTPEQMTQLIEEHLDLIDEFKKEVRQQINNRRRERRNKANSADLSALVEEDRQNREQVRRFRKQEKERLNDRLEEKLKKRKLQKQEHVSEENSDIPPKKPERRRKSSNKYDSEGSIS